jgi:hypothetical protein
MDDDGVRFGSRRFLSASMVVYLRFDAVLRLHPPCWTLLAFLYAGGAQCGPELAKFFREFGGPGHARTGPGRLFEAERQPQ